MKRINGIVLVGNPEYRISSGRDKTFAAVGANNSHSGQVHWIDAADTRPWCFGGCFSEENILSCLRCRYSNICCRVEGE